MTSPEFLGWLDAKMREHGKGKLVPPADVMARRLEGETEARLRRLIEERIIREERVDEQVKAGLRRLQAGLQEAGPSLGDAVRRAFEIDQATAWSAAVADMAARLASEAERS